MNTFLQLLDKGSAQILAPLKRFPLASFSAFIFILIITIKMISKLEHLPLSEYDEIMEKIAFITFFGFFFLLGLRLMTKNIFFSLLGLGILVSIYFYLPESLKDYISNQQGEVIFPMLLAGLFSFIIVAPFIKHKASNREFFEWLKHFLYTILLTALVSIILFLILNITIQILSGLFDMGAKHRYVKYFSLFSFAFFTPYLFLSLLTKEPRAIPIRAYNKAEEIFFKYILTGLFITYFIIIYVYLGKMIMLSEYPKGMVSVNIMAFSALAIMTYLFWTPLWNTKNTKYKKVIWIAILLQVILLAVALYLRVDAYGWTFGRLVLASVGLWLFALSLYALFKKEISFRGIFLALPVIIILNLLFSSSISKSSQQEKLRYLLGSADAFSDDTNISLRYNISSTIEYLHDYHGIDALFPLLPDIVSEFNNQETDVLDNCAIPLNTNFPSFATEKLGFKYIDEWSWKNEFRRSNVYYSKGNPISDGLDIKSYEWVARFDYHKSEVFAAALVCEHKSRSSVKRLYDIKTKAKEIIIEEEKEVLASIDIEKFIKEVIKLTSVDKNIDMPFNNNFTTEEFTHVYEDEKIKVKLIFNAFGFTMKDELVDYGGLILIEKK